MSGLPVVSVTVAENVVTVEVVEGDAPPAPPPPSPSTGLLNKIIWGG